MPAINGTCSRTVFLQSLCEGLHGTALLLSTAYTRAGRGPDTMDARLCQLLPALMYTLLALGSLEEDRDEDKLVP